MRSVIIHIIVILLMSPAGSRAEALTKPIKNYSDIGSPMSVSYMIQILVSFLIVISVIFALAWLMRRTGRFSYGSKQTIKIKSSMSLGMREKILLVEVGGVNILVGVAPGQVRTLHVLDEMEEGNDIDLNSRAEKKGFKQIIEKLSKQ